MISLQEQLRRFYTGGPGVTHIAPETLFDECAGRLDALEAVLRDILTLADITKPVDADALTAAVRRGWVALGGRLARAADTRCPNMAHKRYAMLNCTECSP